MGLTVLTLADAARWDAFVRSFAAYDTYWLSGYAKAFALHGDGEPLLFCYEDGTVRGINAVMRRDIAAQPRLAGRLDTGVLFDLTTPYGYGGWLVEGGDAAPLFASYEAWCAENRIVSEFVRFHPVVGNHVFSEGHYEVIPLGETVAMDLSSPETIWANLDPKNRNMIRKAQKNGLRVRFGRSAALYEAFRGVYNATMERDHAEQYYYFAPSFYESLLNDLPENAQVFWTETPDGALAAASVFLAANGYMSYHLSGSAAEYRSLAPTNLLLYEAALWGCANGCRTLYLGGGIGSGEDSLFAFKKAFYRGGKLRFHIGRKIFLPEQYGELCALRGELPESGYFPRYRA